MEKIRGCYAGFQDFYKKRIGRINLFKHLVITRFNLKMFAKIWDDEIKRKRLDLFEKFPCYTLAAQTNKNFTWLLACDPKTNPELKDNLNILSQKFKFIPRYETNWVQDIKNIGKNSGSPYLITTRIDADDGVSPDFIELIQKNFEEQDFEYISFSYGIKILQGSTECEKVIWKYNPFQSLIENNKDPETIYGVVHVDTYKSGKVRVISNSDPKWIQVVHGDNIANKMNRGHPDNAILVSHFGLKVVAGLIEKM